MNNDSRSPMQIIQSQKIATMYGIVPPVVEEIKKSEDIEKAHPVGFINKYGEQKQVDGSWKYIGKNKASNEHKEGGEKAKKAAIGEFRVHDGKKVKKVAEEKWVEVSEQGWTKKELETQRINFLSNSKNMEGKDDDASAASFNAAKLAEKHISRLSDKEYSDDEVEGGSEKETTKPESIEKGGVGSGRKQGSAFNSVKKIGNAAFQRQLKDYKKTHDLHGDDDHVALYNKKTGKHEASYNHKTEEFFHDVEKSDANDSENDRFMSPFEKSQASKISAMYNTSSEIQKSQAAKVVACYTTPEGLEDIKKSEEETYLSFEELENLDNLEKGEEEEELEKEDEK